MNPILKIGDFSHINHIPIQTLRYYDKIGLLKPYFVDQESHYRYYHINQSQIVDDIQYLRQLDFSLEKIKLILSEHKNVSEISACINEHRQELISEKQGLENRLKEMETYQTGVFLYEDKKNKRDLELLYLPARQLLLYETKHNIYQMTDEDYEFNLRQFKHFLKASKQFSDLPFSRVGSIIAATDFQQRNWKSHQMFLLSREKITGLKTKHYPAGLYASTYCSSFQEEIHKLDYFYQMIKEIGYSITGDYLCEVIYEYPHLHQNKRNMFIRMQIAVSCPNMTN